MLQREASSQQALIQTSENSVPIAQSERKVRFASSPTVYSQLPRMYLQTPAQGDVFLEDPETLRPLSSCIKESDYSLRTKTPENDSFSCCGILILVISLLFLFAMIWWIADKLLLIEIETSMNNNVSPSQASSIRAPQAQAVRDCSKLASMVVNPLGSQSLKLVQLSLRTL